MEKLEEIELPPILKDAPAVSGEEQLRFSSSTSKDEEQGFIKKVYGIVTLQLFITFTMAYLASGTAFGQFCAHPATLIISLVLLAASMIAAMLLKDKVPGNYIALFVFTFSMGNIVSACTASIDADIVLQAIFVTLVMSTAITIFAWTAGENAAMLALVGLILLTFIAEFLALALIFTNSDWARSFYCAAIALLYGCYLVIHTHIIREKSDVDDYIISAIMIYLDIIRIFLYVLAALAKKK